MFFPDINIGLSNQQLNARVLKNNQTKTPKNSFHVWNANSAQDIKQTVALSIQNGAQVLLHLQGLNVISAPQIQIQT